MAKQLFERFDNAELTDDMLHQVAQLFNENYRIWGKDPSRAGSKLGKTRLRGLNLVTNERVGSRMRLSSGRLRAQYLSTDAAYFYVRVIAEDRLAGNAFACR